MIEGMSHDYNYFFSWFGVPIIQYPNDIIAIQEIIWNVKPEIIIETGVAHGGSLLFYSSMLNLVHQKNKKDFKIVGIRPGEKLHEELISKAESYNTFDLGNYFIIAGNQKSINYCIKNKHKRMKIGNNYNSLNNEHFLNISQIKNLIENYKKKISS